MRSTRYGAAMMLLAAVAAVGCSKRSEPSKAKAEATPANPAPVVQTGGEDVPDAPKTIVPTSFADGQAAYQARKYGEATAIFEGYTERQPGNAWGHYMLGLSAWKSGDAATSEKAFEKALSIDPRHVKSYVNLSRVLIEQKRHDDAVEKLTRAADIDPESAEVQRLLGRTFHSQGKTDEAVEAYQRAIDLNDLDAWSMNNLGLVFLDAKRPQEALPLLARAVELRPGVPEFHNNLGMALEHTGRFKAAATAYSGALTADPRYEKAKQNLARVEAVKGGPEAPFVVEQEAKDSGKQTETLDDEKTASK